MRMSTGTQKSLAVMATLVAAFTLFLAVERPWFLSRGATPGETDATLPGDEAVPHATLTSTRAISISAPTVRVWPWLAQLGQDRGGFYSYEILENLVGCEMPSTTRILPEHQTWRPGDRLWMYPRRKLHGLGSASVVSHLEGRHLVFATRQLSTPPDLPWSR